MLVCFNECVLSLHLAHELSHLIDDEWIATEFLCEVMENEDTFSFCEVNKLVSEYLVAYCLLLFFCFSGFNFGFLSFRQNFVVGELFIQLCKLDQHIDRLIAADYICFLKEQFDCLDFIKLLNFLNVRLICLL